jgi:epoxyqueuosine reductase
MTDCPTGALVEPGVLDARRCLAWLLQAPGAFPVEYRVALGDRLYGCDECQERCPVNRRAARVDDGGGAAGGGQAYVPVLEILEASNERLEDMVGRWYIPGREMRYVRRNALVVLGNVGDSRDRRVVAALEAATRDPDPLLRAHAAWAAGRLGLAGLVDEAASDPDPAVASEARTARLASRP